MTENILLKFNPLAHFLKMVHRMKNYINAIEGDHGVELKKLGPTTKF